MARTASTGASAAGERHWQRDGHYHQGGYDRRPNRYYQRGSNHGYSYGY